MHGPASCVSGRRPLSGPCHHVPVTMLVDPAAGGPTPDGPSDDGRKAAVRRRRWLLGGAAVWAAVIVVVGLMSVRHDRPSVKEQTGLRSAATAVDRATGAVLAAVGDRVVAFGAREVTRGCQVTPVRDGAEVARDVTVYLRPGEAGTALDKVAAALPAGYHAQVSHALRLLTADAGDFVAIEGTVSADGGVLTLVSSSGCRPDETLAVEPSAGAAFVTEPLTKAVELLQLTDVWDGGATGLRCPDGRDAVMQTAVGRGAIGDADLRALASPGSVAQATPQRYAYRAGATSMVIQIVGGQVHLSAAAGC
jgi:hypothetical protein